MADPEQARPRFRTRQKQAPAPVDPETLFTDLPRSPHAVGPLWSHQADLLRTYAEHHVKTPDVALELPTGSGKTLVGLLIAEWRRLSLKHRVVYACPTKQLANQVHKAAQSQNIPSVLLTGYSRNWDDRDVYKYDSGKAIAISVYSHVFNTNSRFEEAQTVLFDDAHAAEGYVAEAWGLKIERQNIGYQALLDEVRDGLDEHLVAQVASDSPAGGSDFDEVRLLPLTLVNSRIEDIDRALDATMTDDEHKYTFRMIRKGLRSCLFYLSRREWYIRPFIPPTFDHAAFTNPAQRIYLSATLGEAGELERAFGRAKIPRIPLPKGWSRTGSGRRFFVFPNLANDAASNEGDTAGGLVGRLLDLRRKRLVLTPDNKTAQQIADTLEIPSNERFTAKDAKAGLQPFLDADRGTLLAASRYDGMDLPGKSCRLMIMSGLPDAVHLQDRFLVSKLRAGNVLLERTRTRVVQGAGRCTRGPQDYAVVIVSGSDLVRFLSRQDVQQGMPVELQAEVAFGLDASDVPGDDLVLLTDSALKQDEIWQEDAEPDIIERRNEAQLVRSDEAKKLSETVQREVKAWQHAWRLEWDSAAVQADHVFERFTTPGLRPYRALWAYFGSAWSSLAAEAGELGALERAAKLLRIAHQAAEGTTWLREVQPLPASDPAAHPIDDVGVDGVLTALEVRLRSTTKFDKATSVMLVGLANPDASSYEQALTTLGQLLGAEAYKPTGKGRTDSAWLWESELWVTLEAKSEQKSDGTLSMDYVRKTNTQLDSLVSDQDVDEAPPGSVSVIVSPRTLVDPDAVPIARPHVHLVSPETVLGVGQDIVRAWKEIRAKSVGVEGEALRTLVAQAMWKQRVLPTHIRERLTTDPIRGR